MKRVLHVVMTLDTGGVENWLLHVARRLDPSALRFDFAVASGEGGAYVDELGSLGSKIHFLRAGRDPLKLSLSLRRVLREAGPYDAIHGHLHHVSGLALGLAARAGIPQRIAHSHLDTSYIDRRGGPVRAFYRQGLRRLIRRHATHEIAVSERAARSLFGPDWFADPRVRILPCGLDFERFRSIPDREEARRRLGLPEAAPVFGTVGRLEEQKNHLFLLDVFARLRERRPDARLLLVGHGSLQAELPRRAAELGLAEAVVFTGARADVPELLAAMDVFLFPSLFEGLGLAPIEAQAAGLPCLVSDAVPDEVRVFPERAGSLPLELRLWVEQAEALLAMPRLSPAEAVARIEESPFGMRTHLRELFAVYGVATPEPIPWRAA